MAQSQEIMFLVGAIKAVMERAGEKAAIKEFVDKFGSKFKLASEYKESDDVIDEKEAQEDDEDVMSDSELKEVEQEQKPLTNKDAEQVR